MGRNSAHENNAKRRIFRASTRQVVAKLPDPTIPRKKTRREKRQSIKHKFNLSKSSIENSEKPTTLKVGSINVNGLDKETDQAIRDILIERHFDVR